MDAKQIGKFIHQIRTKKRMTQKELAEQINVTDKAVSKWENGEGCPDVSLLPVLSKVLNVEILDLLEGNLPLENTSKKIYFYNFGTRDVLSKNQMFIIWDFGDLLCNSLSDDFSSIINEKVNFNKSCLDNIKIEYFYKSIETKDENETFFYNFDFEHNGFCIQFDYNLGKSLLKQDSKVYPKISKFDLDSVGEFFAKKVLNNIYTLLNEAISKNCKNLDDLSLPIPKLTSSSKNPSVKNQFVVNPQKMCCLLSVLCNLPNGNSGLINILISKDFLQSEIIQKYIFCNIKAENIEFVEAEKPKTSPKLFVEFGRIKNKECKLEKGKIFVFNKKYDQSYKTPYLDVYYKNQLAFTGIACATEDGAFAVKILSKEKPATNFDNEEDFISFRLGDRDIEENQIEKIKINHILQLNQSVDFPQVKVYKNDCLVGFGEVIFIDGNYAVRIEKC
jgi:transcriptional regulator with XRE-family HTH domain